MSPFGQFLIACALVALVVGGVIGGLQGLGMAAAYRICPACQEFIRRTAQKCPRCHEWLTGVAFALGLATSSAAQGFQMLECQSLNFFGPACVIIEPVITPTPPPVAPQTYPLFRKEEMAPDTPQLMLKLLEEPTEANAEAFLAWQAARQRRIVEVQHLLRTAPRPQP